ncbi:hypothetical protein [Primorskyibacter sp. S187A]|uniref:hypothetical protein n=1 Tax=Primorskyibacter sp. S187A TaxID=3415130 RepID=UPI003C7EC751
MADFSTPSSSGSRWLIYAGIAVAAIALLALFAGGTATQVDPAAPDAGAAPAPAEAPAVATD